MSGGRITRSGAGLFWNGHPWRFTGINIWRAAVTSFNQPITTGYLVNDGTTLADSLAAINAPSRNCNVFRFACFQQFALHSAGNTAPSLPYDWTAIDKVLAVADAAGMKVIPYLADEWNFEGQPEKISTFYTAGNATLGYDTKVLAYEAVTYRQWVADFVARYAGDDRIAVLELMNEPGMSDNPANANTLANAWLTDISGLVKGADPGMLVSTGTGNGGFGFQDANWLTQLQMANVDAGSTHDYTGATNLGATQGGTNGLDGRSGQAATAGKPMYVGEAGLHLNSVTTVGNDVAIGGNRSYRASYMRNKIEYAFNVYPNVAGWMPWHWDSRNYSDDYNYSLSDPALRVLGAYLNG